MEQTILNEAGSLGLESQQLGILVIRDLDELGALLRHYESQGQYNYAHQIGQDEIWRVVRSMGELIAMAGVLLEQNRRQFLEDFTFAAIKRLKQSQRSLKCLLELLPKQQRLSVLAAYGWDDLKSLLGNDARGLRQLVGMLEPNHQLEMMGELGVRYIQSLTKQKGVSVYFNKMLVKHLEYKTEQLASLQSMSTQVDVSGSEENQAEFDLVSSYFRVLDEVLKAYKTHNQKKFDRIAAKPGRSDVGVERYHRLLDLLTYVRGEEDPQRKVVLLQPLLHYVDKISSGRDYSFFHRRRKNGMDTLLGNSLRELTAKPIMKQ